MVRSAYLTPEHLIHAMKRGDFYASSGVTFSDVQFDSSSETLSLTIDGESDVTYQTDFIASLVDSDGADDQDRIGVIVGSSSDLSPQYTLTGKELYVRAVVTSSRPHHDPSFKDQYQQAWTQPVGWQK